MACMSSDIKKNGSSKLVKRRAQRSAYFIGHLSPTPWRIETYLT